MTLEVKNHAAILTSPTDRGLTRRIVLVSMNNSCTVVIGFFTLQ